MSSTIDRIMSAHGCSAETAQRYLDLREEGHQRDQALLMAGLTDPPEPAETVTVPLAPLLKLLIELHDDEYLSEQQCARLLGWDLLTWRVASTPAPHPFEQEP